MKKLLLILTMCIATNAFAQTSFPTSNAIWNESIYKNGVKHEYLYGLLGDTIINDMLYSRLYEFSDTLLLVENIRGYIGALRNEEQKVFFRPPYWEYPDILLYDFGASVGDTVWHNAFMYGYGAIVPYYPDEFLGTYGAYSIIESITIDENYRKKYEVGGFGIFSEPNVWYEGIGSYMGILRSIQNDFLLNGDSYIYELNCFKHGCTIKYLNSTCNKCFCSLQTGISDKKVDSEFIYIYPNPTNSEFRVQSSEFRVQSSEFKIFDIIGRVQQIEYKIVNEELIINISHLQSGIYFLKIDNQTFKIIKN